MPSLPPLLALAIMATTLAQASALGPRQGVTPSPDNTCGPQAGGTYVCPLVTPCCSSNGYCGTGDQYCLTSLGCQAGFSNVFAGGNCYAPTDKETRSPDGTCGKTGAGEYGYRCPVEGGARLCCSAYGYCGNTTAHCAEAEVEGCQNDYGCCGTSCNVMGKRGKLEFA